MSITIKPLTPELSADYFDFFENRACRVPRSLAMAFQLTDTHASRAQGSQKKR